MFPSVQGPVPEVAQRAGGERLPFAWRERIAFLEQKREAAKLTPRQLAARMGISHETIRLYTGGRRGKQISCEFVQRWLSACGVELGPI